MKGKFLFFNFIAFVAFCSCSKEKLELCEANDLAINKSEKAKRNVLEFMLQMESETRGLQSHRIIDSVEPYVLPSTRSALGINGDTLFYVVNFADNNGFAIATPDDEYGGVIAFVESGSFKTAICNPESGFCDLMENLVLSKVMDEKTGPETNFKDEDKMPVVDDPSVRPQDKFEIMKPLLVTQWGQGDPYNALCPGKYTGCVATAVSQICTFLEIPNCVKYNSGASVVLDWTSIKAESYTYAHQYGIDYSPEIKYQIAYLMRFWGTAFGAKYKSDRTSIDTEKAVNTMRNNFNINVTKLADYNADNVINDLKKNKIILMRGADHSRHIIFVFNEYYGRHAWVVDGYIDRLYYGVSTKYLHCNWGWSGKANGYFCCDCFDTDNGLQYNDEGIKDTNSNPDGGYNFRENLQTATFSK